MSRKELFEHRQHVIWTVGLVRIEHDDSIVCMANGVIKTHSNRFTLPTTRLNDDVATSINPDLLRLICTLSINDEDV